MQDLTAVLTSFERTWTRAVLSVREAFKASILKLPSVSYYSLEKLHNFTKYTDLLSFFDLLFVL